MNFRPYQQVYGLIRSAMAANRVQEFPYDWEPGMERDSIRCQNFFEQKWNYPFEEKTGDKTEAKMRLA